MSSILLVLGAWSLRASVVLCVAALARLGVPGRSPGVRHAVGRAGIIGAAAIPLCSWIVPDVDLPLAVPAAIAPLAGVKESPIPLLLGVCWLGGVVLLTARLLMGLTLRHRAQRIPVPPPLHGHAKLAAAEFGVRRPIALRMLEGGRSPHAVGWLRPRIELPAHAASWPIESLMAVLRHETAHVLRHDWPLFLLARVLTAIHWFNPLFHLVRHQLEADAEASCDAAAISAGSLPSRYAATLLALGASAPRAYSPAFGAHPLAARIERVLAAEPTPARPGRATRVGGALLTALVLAVTVASAAVTLEQPLERAAESPPSWIAPVAAAPEPIIEQPPTPTVPPAAVAPAPAPAARPTPAPVPAARPHVRPLVRVSVIKVTIPFSPTRAER